MLAFMPRVLVVADVKPRPAIESARLHAAYVIRHQLFAECVAVVIRNSHQAGWFRAVEALRVGTLWIERDPKRLVQVGAREGFGKVWFSIAVAVAQNFDAPFIALRYEDVAVRRGEEIARIRKAAGVLLDLKTWRHPRLRARRPANFSRAIIRRLRRVRRRQIFHRELVPDAGRVLGPIGVDGRDRLFCEERGYEKK